MRTSIERAAKAAMLPFQIVQDMDVACGYERSFKIIDGKLRANRFLLGIDTADVSQERLIDACQRMCMPDAYLSAFEVNLTQANLVFLGFEDDELDCIYKVYLEFWEKVKARVRSDAYQKEPLLLHLGFKWNTQDNTRCAVSNYTCYPLLSVREILGRLSNIYAGHSDRSSASLAEEIIQFSAHRSVDRSFIYVEVHEDGNPRQSFDINLYKANLRLREIGPFLARIRQHYSVPAEQFDRLYELVGAKLLGHLAGGVDRHGRDFLTVYYEA